MAFGSDELSDNAGSVNQSDSSNVKPMRCLADCGFFGSPQFQGYCSQCYTLCEIAKLTNTGQDHLSAAKVVKNDLEIDGRPCLEDAQAIDDATTANNDTANSSEMNHTTTEDMMKGPLSNSDSAVQSAPFSTRNTTFTHVNQNRSADNVIAENVSEHQNPNQAPSINENSGESAKKTNEIQIAPTINESNPPEELPTPQIQKDRTRCAKCNAKLRLTDMDCVCGLRFCRRHRFSEAHDCSFDYRNEQKRKLTKDIPKVVPRNIKDF